MLGRWSPTIGDPTLVGWLTVFLYFLAGVSCLVVVLMNQRDRRFWGLLSILFLFLCVNKQLDLQSALTATGRCIAQMQGWYENRKAVQIAFILVLLAVCLGSTIVALFCLRGALWRVGFALIGFGLLVGFVAIRAVGFHHFDQFIGIRLANARVNWILEISGILTIQANALAALYLAALRKRD